MIFQHLDFYMVISKELTVHLLGTNLTESPEVLL